MMKTCWILLGIFLSFGLQAQTKQPVEWSFSLTATDQPQQVVLHAKATIEDRNTEFTENSVAAFFLC